MGRGGEVLVVVALACAAGAAGAPDSAAATVPVAEIRFVGCPTDGQMGPRRAPRSGPSWVIPVTSVQGRLSYYGNGELGVLAPAGWHCVAVSGSNGTRVIVTPERRRPTDFLSKGVRLAGPAVVISRNYGGTSGRFAVAAAIARYFPAQRSFVQELERSGMVEAPFPTGAWPNDRITRESENEIRFETPGGAGGEGRQWPFAPEGGAVSGAMLLLPGDEPDLVTIRARAPRLNQMQFLMRESLDIAAAKR